jgi:hypothetical protein
MLPGSVSALSFAELPLVGRRVFHGQAANAKAFHRFSVKPVQLACRTARLSGSSVAFSSAHPAEA